MNIVVMAAALINQPEVVIKFGNNDLRSDCAGCIYGCDRTLPTPNDWENSEKPITYLLQWSSIYLPADLVTSIPYLPHGVTGSFPALVAYNNFGWGAVERIGKHII
ncbi:hypothetical protein [Paenibacillus sp.]|uniref:hypothetical protein n=1 Tax=Paenibacillus sp. TaxID=58172 RepID=UPI0028AD6EC0|nr:hypothetical protein [Paenibacillus sp.]